MVTFPVPVCTISNLCGTGEKWVAPVAPRADEEGRRRKRRLRRSDSRRPVSEEPTLNFDGRVQLLYGVISVFRCPAS